MNLRRANYQGSALAYCLLLGVLAVLPLMLGRHTVLIQDMLVAYYCYFDDFHRQWSLSHWPLWSSSYQTGMPMHAYWQSGWLYPLTWLCFGPLPTQIGLYLFYVLHFAVAAFGFTVLGPHIRLTRMASLWAGTVFALSGTLLARYEHPTFMAGWAYIPWVLGLYLAALRGHHRHGSLGSQGKQGNPLRWPALPHARFALVFLMQALGGHPQATITTAALLLPFTLAPKTSWVRLRRALWANALALVLCLPLFVPFYSLMQSTSRYGGTVWHEGQVGHAWQAEPDSVAPPSATLPADPSSQNAGAFDFREFSAGALRPAHLLALVYPYALGTPAHASWWGREPWTEVYVGLGGLGLLLLVFASWRKASPGLRLLGVTGAVGLWLAMGPLLGASQITFHLPILGDLRRPARWDILFVLALAAFSGQGFRRLWVGLWSQGGARCGAQGAAESQSQSQSPAGRFSRWGLHLLTPKRVWNPKPWAWAAAAHLAAAPALLGLGHAESPWRALLTALGKASGGGKDYVPKLMTLSRDLAPDFFLTALACGAIAALLTWRPRLPKSVLISACFALLIISLVRLHGVHFHRFPSDFYAKPPATLAALDLPTKPYWRVTHYLEYPGDSLWRMHHAPLRSLDLYAREKNALAYGLHAAFGIRHVGAHLPLLWPFEPPQKAAQLSARYLLSDLDFTAYEGVQVKRLGTHQGMHVYEMREYLPRLQRIPARPREPLIDNLGQCAEGFARLGNLCTREERDGHLVIQGLPPKHGLKGGPKTRDSLFQAGDILVLREHAWPGWEARLDQGEWRPLVRDPVGFQFVNIHRNAAQIEIRYFPRTWLWLMAWALICALLLATLCHFYNRKRELSSWRVS